MKEIRIQLLEKSDVEEIVGRVVGEVVSETVNEAVTEVLKTIHEDFVRFEKIMMHHDYQLDDHQVRILKLEKHAA